MKQVCGDGQSAVVVHKMSPAGETLLVVEAEAEAEEVAVVMSVVGTVVDAGLVVTSVVEDTAVVASVVEETAFVVEETLSVVEETTVKDLDDAISLGRTTRDKKLLT